MSDTTELCNQANALERVLTEDGKSVCGVLYIKVSTETLMAQLGGRWIYRNCGAVSHSLFDPPKEADNCDMCGGERGSASRYAECY